MNFPKTLSNGECHLKPLVFLRCLLVFFVAIISAHPVSKGAATVSIKYDLSGNQSFQQTAVATAPIILGAPLNQVVATGGVGGFSINVSSSLAVTCQWYFNGNAIAGATGDSLLLTNVTTANEGSYTVVVTNGSGSVTSGTYKLGVDGNGNGLPDSWELASFGNLNQVAGGDYDGDGISNLDEYLNGTNPAVREVYYWNVASGDFTVPTNWLRYNTPGVAPRAPGPGDTAVINSGSFTLPANTTITVSQVMVNAQFTAPSDADFTLNITGNWTFSGVFMLADGKRFSVFGGGVASVTGPTNLGGGSLVLDNGSTLNLLNVTSYAAPANQTVHWIVQHPGSLLNFPNLTTITGPSTANTYLLLNAQYIDNGAAPTISLPVLTTITKADDGDPYDNSGVQFDAESGGLISAPNLTTFNDNDSHPRSWLTAGGTGVVALPKLLAPKGVNINLNAISHPERFTSLVGTSSFAINAGTVAMSNLASIANFSSIAVDNGAQLSFPNVTSYVSPAGQNVQWLAQHDGSVLSFPNLTSVAGPTTGNMYLDLVAQYNNGGSGATISLPMLTTITKADDGSPGVSSGVRIYANGGGTISAPNLSTFQDNDSDPNSLLSASDTGVFFAPKLLAPRGANINLNALSHPQQFTSLIGTRSFQINAGTVAMSNLTSITGFNYITVDNGAQLSFPNVTSYAVPSGSSVQWLAQHSGSTLSFPNLTSITGPATPNTYLDLIAQYDASATISLPALTTITKADDGDPYADSGVRLTASSGTISTPNLSSFQDNDSHPYSSLTVNSGGTMVLTSLALAGTRGLTLSGVSLPGVVASTPSGYVPQTVITSLPCNITSGGSYVLNNNLSSTQTAGNLITISASNVTIDMHGHFISGPVGNPSQNTVGIYANERSNLTIKDGTIANCSNGVELSGDGTTTTNNVNHQIDNLRVTYCSRQGIVLVNAPSSLVRNCQVSQIGSATAGFAAGFNIYGSGVTLLNNSVSNVTVAPGSKGYCVLSDVGSFTRSNQVSGAAYGIVGGIYQDNVAHGCTTAYSVGTSAGGNSHD